MIVMHALAVKAGQAGSLVASTAGAGLVASLPLWVQDVGTVAAVLLSLFTLTGLVVRFMGKALERFEHRMIDAVTHELVEPLRRQQAATSAQVAALAKHAGAVLETVEAQHRNPGSSIDPRYRNPDTGTGLQE